MARMQFGAVAVLAGLLSVVSASAFGQEISGWERPIEKARLEVSEAQSTFAQAKDVSLVMTQQDGRNGPTGLVLLVDDQVKHFNIVKVKKSECGAIAYAGVEINEPGIITINPLQMFLIDHSHQNCMRVGTYRWEAYVSTPEGNGYLMRSGGYPEPVVTAQ